MSESRAGLKFEDRDGYILLPNSEDHNCFGCSPKNSSGLQMKFYTNERKDLAVSWLSVPGHLCGWTKVVHGGIISTILDEAMGWAALVILKKLVLTKSISVDYLKPIFIGQKIRVEGSVLDVQNERKGVMQACIFDESNEILAKSSSAVSLFTLDSIREMGVLDEKMLGTLEQIVRIG
jgi:uncharacterized protein (TIGR00369 family)